MCNSHTISDELLQNAYQLALEEGFASTSLFQRKLRLQYSIASELIDQLEKLGLVGQYEGDIQRKLLDPDSRSKKEYEITNLDGICYIFVPAFNFNGIATFSPDKRYFIAARNQMIALVDTVREHLVFTNDIFHNVDYSTLVITNHPYILVRDIISNGRNRQNDIYLLNDRSDVLLKVSVNAHIYRLTVSDNGKFVAAQTLDNKIRLFRVDDWREIANWNTPKKVAIDLKIDLTTEEVRMFDHQNNIYSYSFSS